jgi:cell division protein FtsI (penicillin-binding protein 3)
MDPRTGGILAIANDPGYDANKFPDVSQDRQRNRAVTDTYEPGSTFKIVTISGALETGIVTPTTKFTLPYEIQVADRKIHDAEPRGTQTMTTDEILSRSSNVGVVTIAEALGQTRVNDWIHRFGFGRPTGIDFPGESKGIVLAPEEWSGSTIGNVPIGQGIAVTPVQMIAAYGALANRGVLIEPHLVDRVGDGERVQPARRRVVSTQTADQVRHMLREVVEEGSGTAAQVPGYRIAGKTGTAAKPDGAGGYSTSAYVASFVGFVPAKHPSLVILVTVDEPRGAIWGGVVAAPAFAEVAKFALQYLEIPPD